MIINYFLCGFLGLIFVTLVKMSSTQKEFTAAGHPFKLDKFFKDELIGISMGVVFIITMAVTVGEWQSFSATVQKYVLCIFVMGGAIGSWAFQLFLGKSKKYIRNVIDLKTNAFDNEAGKSSTIKEIKQNAKEAGMDVTKPNP